MSSQSDEDVTRWVGRMKDGDAEAVQPLWERYYDRLVALARAKLQGLPRRAADEEDVVLSAFNSFWKAAQAGRFPKLEDRDDLWQLLVVITARKAVDLREHEGRDKRDWRRVQEAMAENPDASTADILSRVVTSAEPDPAFAAQVAEQSRELLSGLPDDQLRRIAVMKMEGHTNREISRDLGVAEATVERRLARIRRNWGEAVEPT